MRKHLNKIRFAVMLLPVIASGIGLFGVMPQTTFATTYSTIGGGAGAAKGNSQADSLFGTNGIFINVTNTLLFIIGAIAVLMLIYGGVRYTVSGGNADAVKNAKNTILYAIVGIVVAVLAFAAVNFVIGQIGQTAAPETT